jgi:ATP-dependent protease Clp ATPase subunit
MLNEPNSPAFDGGPDDVLQPEGVTKDKVMADPTTLSPREIVAELDRYIIGQKDAKRAVSARPRSRADWRSWRRRRSSRSKRRNSPRSAMSAAMSSR